MITSEEKATNNVKINLVHPYTKQIVRMGGNLKFQRLEIPNKDELDFFSDEQIEAEEKAMQNTVLALITTPRMLVEGDIPTVPIKVLTAYSHASFVTAFNLLSNDEKKEIKIVRSFWVGDTANMPQLRESSDVEKIASDLLVNSLAEKVRLYKANPLTGRLAPFKPTLDPSVFEGGIEYREYLERIKGKSKYDFEIVKALADGKSVKPAKDFAFGFETDVITKDEIDRVVAAVKTNPEPTLAYRPAALNQAESIANAIKQALQPVQPIGDK